MLRRLYGRESLLFPSGWQLNTGFIAALAAAFGKDVFFLADRLVHASMIDGLLAAKRHGAGFCAFRTMTARPSSIFSSASRPSTKSS